MTGLTPMQSVQCSWYANIQKPAIGHFGRIYNPSNLTHTNEHATLLTQHSFVTNINTTNIPSEHPTLHNTLQYYLTRLIASNTYNNTNITTLSPNATNSRRQLPGPLHYLSICTFAICIKNRMHEFPSHYQLFNTLMLPLNDEALFIDSIGR